MICGDAKGIKSTPASNTIHMTGNMSKSMTSRIAKIHEQNNPQFTRDMYNSMKLQKLLKYSSMAAYS